MRHPNAVHQIKARPVVAAMIWAVIQLAALASLLSLPPQIFGAEMAKQYLTDVWTADNGLPNSSVTAIVQTPDGYLWVGTYNGLARFDGLRFVTFDPANTPALAHARVRKLSVDVQGTLWVNTYDGAMTSLRNGIFAREWNGNEGIDPDVTLVSSSSNQVTFLLHRGSLRRKSTAAPAGTGWEDLVPNSRAVGALCVADGEGTIWYRSADKRLSRLAGGQFEPLTNQLELVDQHINCLATDARGRLWIGTSNDIACWNGKQFQTRTPASSEAPSAVDFIAVTGTNRFWALTGGRVREGSDRRWLREAESLRNIFTGNLSRTAAQGDHQGGLWLYDYERGLFHVNAVGESRHFGLEDNFPGDRINCFFEDREGNWWAGLDAGGLVRIRERRFQSVIPDNLAKPAKAVCEERNGTVWIGTLGDGLECWPAGGPATNLVLPGGTGRGFAFSVCPDAAGRLWVSAGAEDLFVRERDGFRRVSPLVHGVKALLGMWSGRVWAGTKSGLFFSDNDAPTDFKAYEGIGRSDIRSLAEDGRGNLWAGTEDGTLFRIKDEEVTAFRPTDLKESHAIWSLLVAADGTVWAGTFRGGLLRFRDGQFTRYEKKDGLPDDVICQILDDGRGNLWLGSYQGITCVAKSDLENFSAKKIQTLNCTTYGRADGLPSLECSGGYQPSAWRGQDGRLWFTTLKGAISVQPNEIKLNSLPPSVVIEEVLVDGESIGVVNETSLLEVPPGKHQLEFRYTGNSLIASDRVQFRYQLESADAGWVDAGARRSSGQYNYLPPGDYRFHVLAANSDGVWDQTGVSLKIKILPHFYETLWFKLLAGGIILGVVVS